MGDKKEMRNTALLLILMSIVLVLGFGGVSVKKVYDQESAPGQSPGSARFTCRR